MNKRTKKLIFLVGWAINLISCSFTSIDRSTNQQLSNLESIVEKSSVSSLIYDLSPSGEWYIESLIEPSDKFGENLRYRAISTKDPNIIYDQIRSVGLVIFDSWAPDSSAFVARGYSNQGKCTEDKIVIYKLDENKLSVTVFPLPQEDCTLVSWAPDSDNLAIFQSDTIYNLNTNGLVEQEFSYVQPINSSMSILHAGDGIFVFHNSYPVENEFSEFSLEYLNLAHTEIKEEIYTTDSVLFFKDFNFTTGLIIFAEEKTNRIWIYDTNQNLMSPTSVTPPSSEYLSIDFIGGENRIGISYQCQEGSCLNIYNLDNGELLKSWKCVHNLGWHSDFQGFLVWVETIKGKELKIIK